MSQSVDIGLLEDFLEIDIKGLDKVDLLQALWEDTKYIGFSVILPDQKFDRKKASTAVLKSIDYFCGKPIKCDLSDTSFNPWLYDRDAGQGKAAKIVENLRKKANSHEKDAK